jgi:hypothetical protein
LPIPVPEQRETYCHECLTENPRTRTTCVNCGARLRHPKEFTDVMREMTPTVNVGMFGNIGALLGGVLYGLAVAILAPQWIAANLVWFVLGAAATMFVGRLAGRFLARQLNDSSV